MSTWVLAPPHRSEDPRFFLALARCERLSSICVPLSERSPDHAYGFHRKVVASASSFPDIAYGVASVYTPPRHRERGYAKHLMRLSHCDG